MNRRTFVQAGLMTATLFATTNQAFGKEAKTSATSKDSKEKLGDLGKTAADCAATGDACVAHCVEMLADGHKAMAGCHRAVLNMIPVCAAIAKLAVYKTANPATLKDLVSGCAKLCRDCSAACKEHAQHSAACKTCMDACDRCAEACEAYLA